MPVIRLETLINADQKTVFDFSRSIDLHQISTAQTNERVVAGRSSGLIQLGESVTWEARHFRIVQKLTAKITQMQEPEYFVDEMVSGAFKSFRHEHIFEVKGEETLMTDVFTYVSPLGILGKLADQLFLEKYMTKLLIQRNKVIKEYAEKRSQIESNILASQNPPTLESVMYKLRNSPWHLDVKLNAPASKEDIDHLEQALNRKLPADFVNFYLQANGFETTDYLFRVLPIAEIIDYHKELVTNEIYIADYMIYTDNWRIVLEDDDTENYRIVNDNHGAEETITLTNSLFEFLNRYVIGDGVLSDNGLYTWREEKLRSGGTLSN